MTEQPHGKAREVCPHCGEWKSRQAAQCRGCSNKKMTRRVLKPCETCGKTMRVKPFRLDSTKYCSRPCMAVGYARRMVGAENPNFRDRLRRRQCGHCGRSITGYMDTLKYCSRRCKHESESFRDQMRLKGRKDLNHDVIANAFEQMYCPVLDLSKVGRGMPDLLVLCGTVWHLVEIKNPDTAYGRKGLNKRQQEFKDKVQGCVENVSTVEGVVELVTRWRAAPEQKIWREA